MPTPVTVSIPAATLLVVLSVAATPAAQAARQAAPRRAGD